MTHLKNTLFLIVFVLTIGSLSSCLRSILGFECGSSTVLGTLRFADSTKTTYSNWTGKETLVFKDSLGNEQEYASKQGKMVYFQERLTIRTLCDSGWLDKQTEYFESEGHFVDFVSKTGFNYLRLDLHTDTLTNKGSYLIFDRFSAGFNSTIVWLASAREKPIPADAKHWVYSNAPQFVADTTILNKNFKNVYYATNTHLDMAVFFQKSKIIIGYKDAGKTWLLDKIK